MVARSSRIIRILIVLVLLLGFGGSLAPFGLDVAAPRVAWAAPITVTNTSDSGAGSLRQALADAAAGDTITFSVPASSTITLSSTLVITKQLTIDGSTAAGLTVSGNHAVRVFDTSAPLTLRALTITKGNVAGLGPTGQGGGLRSSKPVTLTNVLFFDNVANAGGGMQASGATIQNTQFISNTATATSNPGGGGALVAGTLIMTGTQFISNTAAFDGGGLWLNGAVASTSLIGQGLFKGNRASDEGGGLFILGTTNFTFRLQASRLIDNQATQSGGGLYLSSTPLAQMDNNILAGNTSPGAADIGIGGLSASAITARHNTFAAAAGVQGPAIHAGKDNVPDTVTLTNSIFSDYGTALRTGPAAAAITVNGVLWSNVTTQTQQLAGSIAVTNAYTGTAAFVNPAARDYHLRRASAAIDKGVSTGLTTDIDGQARPTGSAPDLGADEFVNIAPTISNIADQTTSIGVAVGPIPFTVGDANTDPLTVTVSSSNTTLVPTANIVLGGSGANRTLTITPAVGKKGTTTITVTVSDGQAQVSDTFVLTVGGYKLYLPPIRR
jgi:hypothetical protein